MVEVFFYNPMSNDLFAVIRDLPGFRFMFAEWLGDFQFDGKRYNPKSHTSWRGREAVEKAFAAQLATRC